MPPVASNLTVPADYSDRIKRARGRLALTQQALADRLGISFATVNRWENAQTKPSRFYWTQIEKLVSSGDPTHHELRPATADSAPVNVGRKVQRSGGDRRSVEKCSAFGHTSQRRARI